MSDAKRGYFGAVAGMCFEIFDPKPLLLTIGFEAGALGRAPHVAARLQL